MDWTTLMSPTRFKIENGEIIPIHSETNPYRSPFHTDYDRVVFSNAFRRLGRKTQVHPLAKNDHTHNRLTHSVEVASVGRSLGYQVGVSLAAQNQLPSHISPNDIATTVQTACLAHDIGNPPFGHTGEDALREWFRQPENEYFLEKLSPAEQNDIQTYEGNAHSLRQTASIEMYRNHGGMRLTAASYGALLKYPWTSSHPKGSKKFNIYQTELSLIRRVAQELRLPENGADCWARHPLSYLMEAADDICYALMDLEDAVSLGLLNPNEVIQLLTPIVQPEKQHTTTDTRSQISMLRGLAIGKAINSVADTFMQHHNALLQGEFAYHDLLAATQPHISENLAAAKQLARDKIFRHRSKLVQEIAAFPCINSMLSLFVPAAYNYIVSGCPNTQQTLALDLLETAPITKEDSLYQAYMKILDFIGGMTDNYAAQTARELSGNSLI
ncbi:deoxyguanosinetriphosphate triphosphohydrolase [Kingella negevensis]|uniref:deoxyguanosinetriphosphate triphosphohydrolase n=2 Tax=Kingella negevensis TaxID=1522312 RepID=UPI00254A2CA7|nr:deoxyguanosinetriphosphate triphosphohydrolase [Kingella negevensis]MDK4707837.1 deoxyguanosinetriphosphate triphosphohydrolase [Kingella negevensis]MDK4709361.1 deoxyguanosinetriphosphate triphosphohydrolase [Kingella negevensis]